MRGTRLAPITGLDLDARGGWRVRLADGAVIVLGHGQDAAALASFAHAASVLLESRPHGFERADLRYANGFAVRWRPEPDAGTALTETARDAEHGKGG